MPTAEEHRQRRARPAARRGAGSASRGRCRSEERLDPRPRSAGRPKGDRRRRAACRRTSGQRRTPAPRNRASAAPTQRRGSAADSVTTQQPGLLRVRLRRPRSTARSGPRRRRTSSRGRGAPRAAIDAVPTVSAVSVYSGCRCRSRPGAYRPAIHQSEQPTRQDADPRRRPQRACSRPTSRVTNISCRIHSSGAEAAEQQRGGVDAADRGDGEREQRGVAPPASPQRRAR